MSKNKAWTLVGLRHDLSGQGGCLRGRSQRHRPRAPDGLTAPPHLRQELGGVQAQPDQPSLHDGARQGRVYFSTVRLEENGLLWQPFCLINGQQPLLPILLPSINNQ